MGHLLLVILGFIILSSMAMFLFRKLYDHSGIDYLLFSLLFVILWLISFTFYYYEPRPYMAKVWFLITYFARSMVFVSLWIFAIMSTNPFYKIRKQLYLALFFIPFISLFFIITNGESGMFFTTLRVIQINPDKSLEITRGLWFYVDFFYSLVTLLVPILIYFKHYKSVPLIFQFQYFINAIAFSVIFLSQILNFFISNKLGEDILMIGTIVGFVIIYYNLFHYRRSDLLMLAKDAIFETISCVCLVIENDGKILNSNPEAKKLFAELDTPLEKVTYEELRNHLVKTKDAYFEKSGKTELLRMVENEKEMFFQILTSAIMDKNSEKIGDFIEIRDITEQQELISELYKQANFDQLTTLHNRRYFEDMCLKYDKKEYYPLCVITGDLNKLKYTNDTFGHKAGDQLIVLIGKILKKSNDRGGIIARTGGDEFSILFPKTNANEALEYIEKVHKLCMSSSEYPFGSPSISLGYAIKTSEEQKMDDIILLSDMEMYKSKSLYKKKQKADLIIDSSF